MIYKINYKIIFSLKIISIYLILFFLFILSSCSTTQLAVDVIKKAQKEIEKPIVDGKDLGPGGVYKIGKPYIIKGVRYVPKLDLNYDKTGIASWYGKDFHGKRTANGEIYNMNALTAAHKTLPMPTYVQVINLDNGRSIVVRVNDRGPFVNNRIIDMSKRGAQLLGFQKQGLAKVRVKVIGDTSESFISKKPNTTKEEKDQVIAAPIKVVTSKPINEKSNSLKVNKNTPIIALEPIESADIYIQFGSFILYNNANKLSAKLTPFGETKITSIIHNEKEFFRVRMGPIKNIELADMKLEQVIQNGFIKAKIIID